MKFAIIVTDSCNEIQVDVYTAFRYVLKVVLLYMFFV